MAATLLAAILTVLVNILGMQLYVRGPVSSHLYGELTDRTLQVLDRTEGDLQLIAFFEKGHPLAEPVRALLQEFAEASRSLSNLRIRTRVVDPNRDAAIAADLARRYSAEPNTLIVQTRSQHRILTPEELVVAQAPNSEELGLADFAGESAVTAAIWNATRAGRPIVYFLAGHGEHDPFDFDRLNGYSSMARHLRRDRYELRPLVLTPTTPFPEDCSMLVIAGPRTFLGTHALEQINTYLSASGRLLLLLDNATDSGLQSILNSWGITAHPSPQKLGSGSNIRMGQLRGNHPITQVLGRIEVTFESPCLLEIAPEALQPGHADRPHAFLLLAPPQVPSLLSDITIPESTDKSRIALAVASERGSQDASERSYLARIVVVGDAQFVSNAMIDGGLDGNRDFFISAVHWLTEQDVLIGRMPVTFRILRSGISPIGWTAMALRVVVFWPLGLYILGMLLTHRRRSGSARL